MTIIISDKRRNIENLHKNHQSNITLYEDTLEAWKRDEDSKLRMTHLNATNDLKKIHKDASDKLKAFQLKTTNDLKKIHKAASDKLKSAQTVEKLNLNSILLSTGDKYIKDNCSDMNVKQEYFQLFVDHINQILNYYSSMEAVIPKFGNTMGVGVTRRIKLNIKGLYNRDFQGRKDILAASEVETMMIAQHPCYTGIASWRGSQHLKFGVLYLLSEELVVPSDYKITRDDLGRWR